jgi:hypothetical protein
MAQRAPAVSADDVRIARSASHNGNVKRTSLRDADLPILQVAGRGPPSDLLSSSHGYRSPGESADQVAC